MGGHDSNFEIDEAGDLRANIGYLSAIDLFRDLTPEEMEEVERAMVMQTYRAGSVFYTPGDTGEVLFILKQGVAQLYRYVHGWTQTGDRQTGAGLFLRRDELCRTRYVQHFC